MRRRRFLATCGATGGTLLLGSAGCSAPAALPAVSLVTARGRPEWPRVARAVAGALVRDGLARGAGTTDAPGSPVEVARRVLTGDGAARSRWLVAGLHMLTALEMEGAGGLLASATPLARLIGEREVVVVPAASRLRDFGAFADALRRDPGGVQVAGGPPGGADHLLFGLIAQGLGVDVRRIDYAAYATGEQAAAAVLGGSAAVAIGPVRQWRDRLAARDARPLAVSSAERIRDVRAPSLRECGVRIDYADWCGLVAPPGMSENERFAAMIACDRLDGSPSWRESCRAEGWTALHLGGDSFRRWLTGETTRIHLVLRDLGLLNRPEVVCRGGCRGLPSRH